MSASSEAEDFDGDWNGEEADVDGDGVGLGDEFDGSGCFLGSQAEGLEDRGYAVAQVGAEEGHGDDVEENDEGILESDDHHCPGVGFAEFGELRSQSGRCNEGCGK